MSILKVNPGDVETFTVVTNPLRHYVSSSVTGATGSVHVYARRSDREKDSTPLDSFVEATHNDADLETALRSLQYMGRYAHQADSTAEFVLSASQAFPGMLSNYMSQVTAQGRSARKQKALDVIRFTPTVSFTSNTVRKLIVKDTLSTYYRTDYPSAHWAYTNYNSINFYTASTVPTSSCLMYPNIDAGEFHEGFVSGVYTPSGAISFDFYINPRYRPDQADGDFKAGTIFHLTSTYALSLVTGSAKDPNGLPLGFRLKLQLSHSADVAPSRATKGTYPNDLIFLSDDNSLLWNNWHHVVVRWGTDQINQGTGSFNIDGADRGLFVVPSGTVAPRLFNATKANPDVLIVGNYYEGFNDGVDALAFFFSSDVATREGLEELIDDGPGVDEPDLYTFRHPLNAELHDLSIKRYYMSDADIQTSASIGIAATDSKIAMYVPAFFIKASPFRKFVGDHGGVLQTPFFEIDGTTTEPFNIAMSFGVDGHYINLENFLYDYASAVQPRLHQMSGSAITVTTNALEANDFLYADPFIRRRNTLIMPCDDGNFVPNFDLIKSLGFDIPQFDDLGIEEASFVNVDNMLNVTASLLFASDFGGDSTFADESIGFTPENPGAPVGPAYQGFINASNGSESGDAETEQSIHASAPLTIFQRTRDPSSNQVTFFDISNMYYGNRIMPGTLVIKDPSLSGSGGAVNITLKDDGRGTLYRANSFTSASTWNAVGTVFYNEGIIAIKNPHLYFFGKEGYEISFRGEQSVHVLRFDIIAPANQLNSSSNPNFKSVAPSPFPNDPEKEFVYITGINFHDDNMNVVMKTQLAQPIIKRHGDRLMFKVRVDL